MKEFAFLSLNMPKSGKRKFNKIQHTLINMKKNDYFFALKLPFILLIIHTILSYFAIFHEYRNVTSYEEAAKVLLSFSLPTLLLMIFVYFIVFYASFNLMKYRGSLKDPVILGILIALIQAIFTLINMALLYYTSHGYKMSIDAGSSAFNNMLGLNSLGSSVYITLIILGIGIIISLFINIIIYSIIGIIGYFIGKRYHKL